MSDGLFDQFKVWYEKRHDYARAWKQRTGFDWKTRTGARLWQAGFYDRVLREHDDTRAVVRYIVMNPVRAGLVTEAGDYPWTGSLRYTLTEILEGADLEHIGFVGLARWPE